MIDRIRAEIPRWARPVAAARCRIGLSQLGEYAGLLGAARLALSLSWYLAMSALDYLMRAAPSPSTRGARSGRALRHLGLRHRASALARIAPPLLAKSAEGPGGRRYVVGSGVYNDRMERAFVVDAVTDAVARVERTATAAYPLFRDLTGPFIAKGPLSS